MRLLLCLSTMIVLVQAVAIPSPLSGADLEDEPPLPAGLGLTFEEEPALPIGLGQQVFPDDQQGKKTDWQDAFPFDITGFAETRLGIRTQDDLNEKDASIGETRLQLSLEKQIKGIVLNLTTDFLYDPVLNQQSIDLESGEGWFDLREANFLIRPFDFLDIKVGRQALTWGSGDLIFVNDLFAKDWNSFFIGRDEEYLKAPTDAIKLAFFNDHFNVDFIYTPVFDADRFIDGRRISYFNQNIGSIVGRNAPVLVEEPNEWFSDDEFAFRIYRNFGSVEAAIYGYDGFWKSPNGQNVDSGLFIFPKLSVYGASLRGPVASGIGYLELGYYNSHDDSQGDNPFIRNSEFRTLIGYEQEIFPEFTAGFQYYLEHMMDYDIFLSSLATGLTVPDENRHVLTIRLTKLMMNQNLVLSLFCFYSPSDKDAYLRPKVKYKVSDAWQTEVGSNIFYGQRDDTFFGQFKDDTNIYAAIRYSF